MKIHIKFSYVIKFVYFVYLIALLILKGHMDFKIVAFILLNAAVIIIMERFNNSVSIIILEFLCITLAAYNDSSFAILYAVNVFDFVYAKQYTGIIPSVLCSIYFYQYNRSYNFFVYLVMSGLFAYIIKDKKLREESYRATVDDERRLRYELESAKLQLMNSAKEAAYIAEVKERNRIARDIHDNIGHSIAGILMKLQVAFKLYGKDDEKAKEALKNCIDGLSGSLIILRETVHNIKPKENLGIEYITNIIDNFKFCKVEFVHSGDFNMISPNLMEIVVTNIKEALTNAAKYSKATLINIDIDISKKYLRLYIKNNGVGIKVIKEGLGLSGMRERVKNAGGTMSVSGENGFLIVCVIPNKE